MVKHIVCFKLKDRKKSEEAKEILLSMRGKVPTAQEIEVGVDFWAPRVRTTCFSA